jgi:hypothetical protein
MGGLVRVDPTPDEAEDNPAGGGRPEGIRVEYQALRQQIADADKTCVTLLGALLAGSTALVTFSVERGGADVAWLLSPLWLVGHMYLAEKRSMIMKTAYYIRNCLESRQTGLGWEGWHRKTLNQFVRYYPFYLECAIATVVILLTPVFVLYLSKHDLTHEPWFFVSLFLLLVFLPVVLRSIVGWHRSSRRLQADDTAAPGEAVTASRQRQASEGRLLSLFLLLLFLSTVFRGILRWRGATRRMQGDTVPAFGQAKRTART